MGVTGGDGGVTRADAAVVWADAAVGGRPNGWYPQPWSRLCRWADSAEPKAIRHCRWSHCERLGRDMLYEDGEMKLGAYEHDNGYGNDDGADDDGDYDGDSDNDDDDTLAVMTVTMMMVTLFHTGCPCTQRFIFFLG